MTIAKFIEG